MFIIKGFPESKKMNITFLSLQVVVGELTK